MDDLDCFIRCKAQRAVSVPGAGSRPFHQEYESLASISKVSQLVLCYHSWALENGKDKETGCCEPLPAPTSTGLNQEQHQQSKWHQALQKVEERRKWNKMSNDLSQALGRWMETFKAQNQKDPPTIPEAALHITKEASGSSKKGDVALVEYKNSSDLEISKVATQHSNGRSSAEQDETANTSCVDSSSTPPIQNDRHNESIQISKVKDLAPKLDEVPIATPKRPTSEASSPVDTPATPQSARSPAIFDSTPDTPPSLTQPFQHKINNAEPESPCPRPVKAQLPSKGASGRDLDDRNQKHEPMAGVSTQNSDPDLYKQARNLAAEIRAAIKKSNLLTNDICQELAYLRRESGHISPTEKSASLPRRQHVLRSPPSSAVLKPQKPRSFSGLQIYETATGANIWEYFRVGSTRCYGWAKTKNRRCSINTIKGTRDTIYKCIQELENIDAAENPARCLRLIEDLANQTLCHVEWSTYWRGHRDGVTGILRDCKRLIGSAAMEQSAAGSLVCRQYVTGAVDLVPASELCTGFEAWQPARTANRSVSSCLENLAIAPLDLAKEAKSGYIYAYRTEGISGYVKIGFTGRDVPTRLAEWQRKCSHKPISILDSSRRIAHVARVEELVHTELKDCRHVQTKCGCRTTHIEWFRASPELIENIVEKWSTWMESEPYDEYGHLKSAHDTYTKEVCQSITWDEKAKKRLLKGHVIHQSMLLREDMKRLIDPAPTRLLLTT